MKSMVMGKTLSLWVLVGIVLLAVSGFADWPQFEGPNRNGASPETGLLRAWPENGPKVLWTLPMAAGYSGAAVRDGEIYVLDREGKDRDVVRCLDLNTGNEIWRYAYDAKGTVSHDGPRATPAVDDKYVFVVGMFGHFNCIDRKTHQPVWTKNLCADFNVSVPGWGVVQNPVLYKDLVIVAPQAPDAFVAAFKRDTGDLVWKSPSLGGVGYVSPAVHHLAGIDQVVMAAAGSKNKPGRVAGLSVENGSPLWSYEGWQCKIPIAFPALLPDDRLFVTGGYGAGTVILQIKPVGNTFAVKELLKTDVCASQIHQPLQIGDYLYVNSNSNEREDGMMCLTLDGQVKWKTHDDKSLPKFERGDLLLADNLIFNMDGQKGVLHMVEPSPDGYKELGQVKVLGGKEIWAPMALSDGKLILRSQEELKCLDLKNP